MEAEVFGGVLTVRGERDARGGDRLRAEYREFLVDDAHVGVVLEQHQHVAEHALAIAAVIIEELDQRDVATGVAGDRRCRVVDQRLALAAYHQGFSILSFPLGC